MSTDSKRYGHRDERWWEGDRLAKRIVILLLLAMLALIALRWNNPFFT